jgi:hypothetical protein
MLVALVALCSSLVGGATAATLITSGDIARDAVRTKHVKNGTLRAEDFGAGQLPAGAPGPTGAPGEKGDPGPAGSPDSADDVLTKLLTVDGTGSTLDADLFDGLDSAALQRRGTTTACGAGANITAIGADGNVTCAADGAGGAAGGVLGGTYPNPGFQADVNELVPVTAFVFLGSTGVMNSSTRRAPMTGAPVVTRNSAGDYTVDLPGLVFIASVDVANCTVQDSVPFFVVVSSVNGNDLAIRTFNGAGTAADPARLHCTVYDLG